MQPQFLGGDTIAKRVDFGSECRTLIQIGGILLLVTGASDEPCRLFGRKRFILGSLRPQVS